MTQTLKSRKGVTLVELLAVIVILGIIAAIAVPTIGGLIERQRQNAAEATFVSIQEAARLYGGDLTAGTAFSLQDLIDDNALSNTPVMTFEDDSDATAADIFVVQANGSILVDPTLATHTGLQIDGYVVYP